MNDLREEAACGAAGLQSLSDRYDYIDSSLQNCLQRLYNIEQYSRINSLLFHGFIKPPKGLHGRALKLWILNELNKLFPDLEGGPVQASEIEFGHTFKTRKNVKHVLIVKFSCRFTRNAIFYAKSSLPKQSGVSITEHLTHQSIYLLNAAKEVVGDKNAWTSQTRIFAKTINNAHPIQITCPADINTLTNLMAPYVRPGRNGYNQNPPPPPGFTQPSG